MFVVTILKLFFLNRKICKSKYLDNLMLFILNFSEEFLIEKKLHECKLSLDISIS